MKKYIVYIFGVLLTFIVSTVIVSLVLLNSDKILKNFNIISVDNTSTKYKVRFEKVKAAINYDIIIYNENNGIFYSKNVTDTSVTIDLPNIEYDQKYKLVVYAYDETGQSISVNNPYEFTYREPTFSKDNNLVLTNDKDYELLIDGDLTHKNYTIGIYDGDYKIMDDSVTSNTYTITKNLFTNMQQKLTVKLFDGNNVINTIDLYSNMSPVGDIKILSPENATTLDYNDIVFKYEGGDNADSYVLQIYNGNNLIKEKTLRNKRAIISSDFFRKSETYTLKIKGTYKDYGDYTKEDTISFTMNEKDTLKPAYLNKYPKAVKKGTKLELINPNKSGDIYYTLDGKDPNTYGIKYTEPIEANQNFMIKSVVKDPKMNNSIVSEFGINVGQKQEYRIYLSPSNQDGNIGVRSVGYTNEMAEMNDLTDYVEEALKNKGVKVYRNNPNGNINLWNSEAKYYNCDFKLAIHSNASGSHTTYGIETWIDEQGSFSYSLGNIIQKDLVNIYYNKEDEKANRGVKYANGALGEANDNYFPFGILVEVAHHDYKEDALWIMSNKKLIGETLANSMLDYFDIN